MRHESQLDRTLWTIVLTAAVVVVAVSFARQPLAGGGEETSRFGAPVTLWLPASQADSQAEAVAEQAAACWGAGGQSVTVGVLPGSSSAAVAGFLGSAGRTPTDLLVITSTTLSDIARDDATSTPASEAGEVARRAVRLLGGASPVTILGLDRLSLAIRADSPIRSTSELLSLMRREPSRPLLGVAEDTWEQGNLAALTQSANLHGEIPYSAFRSPREALASLQAHEVEVIVAPQSELSAELRDGRLRELRWPARRGAAPRAWIALVAPPGLSAIQVSALRGQAQRLCAGPTWQRALGRDGLAPAFSSSSRLNRFLSREIGEASTLQAVAAKVVRDD